MAHLNKAGWENVTDAKFADLIIVNSCGFIESAKQESINAVIEWRKLYPNKKILLAGCLSQRYEKELSGELTEADGFFGVEALEQITQKAELICNDDPAQRQINPKVRSTDDKEKIITGERPLLSLPGSAYVKISEGCNNNCSYCAIPLIRGGLVCRSIPDIVDECRLLLKRGIKELCLIGQDIGAYTNGLVNLLKAIAEIDENFWVRLLYIHPDHFPMEALDLMESDKRFLPYFDIPFQHASAKILKLMNRNKKQHEEINEDAFHRYLELINTIRGRLSQAIIRSTFLLGFPGETDKDFSALLDFQKEARLDWLGCFTYSREEGTESFTMKARVPAKIAALRKQTIEEAQVSITEKSMDRFAGLTLDVLIEEQVDDFFLGRLYCQAPDIDGAAVITGCDTNAIKPKLGSLVPCKVIARRGFDLEVIIV